VQVDMTRHEVLDELRGWVGGMEGGFRR
jgi:hypothetical protein